MESQASSITVGITEEPISVDGVRGMIGCGSCGAEVLFFGVVRNSNDGRSVTAVSYDAFKPLAESVFSEICAEVLVKWGQSLRVALFHRIGRLVVGEISVAIAVGSPHRAEAYDASRYVIEQIKIRAPIWKKEHYADGDSEWLKGHPAGVP